MSEYDRNDLDEGIDLNKTSHSRECGLCHFWYFLDKNFNHQKNYCNGCHDMSMETVSIKYLAIVYSKGNPYRIHFWYMSKDDAISIMHTSNLIDKKDVLEFFKYIFFMYFFLYIKISQTTCYQRNRDIMLNRTKEYYENNKELSWEQAKNKYRSLSEDEKDIKKQYQKARYHNMSDEEKHRLKDYQKITVKLEN